MKTTLACVLIVLALGCMGYTCYEVLIGKLGMFEPDAIVAYPFHAVCMIVAFMLLAPMRTPKQETAQVDTRPSASSDASPSANPDTKEGN